MIIHKKSIKKLAVALEKINYLYGSIKRKEGKAEQVELKLMKKYASDLYDLLLEVELKSMALETETIAVPKSQISFAVDQVEANPSKIEQFIEEPVEKETLAVSATSPMIANNVEALFTAYESEEKVEKELEIEDILDFSPDIAPDPVEIVAEAPAEKEEEVYIPPEYLSTPSPDEEEEEEEIYVFEEENVPDNQLAADTLDLGMDKDFSDIEKTISEIQEQRKLLEEETLVSQSSFQQNSKISSFDEVIEASSKTKILNDLLEKDPPIEHIVEEELAEEKEEMTAEETPAAINDLYKNQQAQPSIADQLGASTYEGQFPISFNQRFAFINQLFDGDTDAFNHSMNELGDSRGYIEALTYINLNLRHDYKWQDDDPVVKDFLDMIKRKFLG